MKEQTKWYANCRNFFLFPKRNHFLHFLILLICKNGRINIFIIIHLTLWQFNIYFDRRHITHLNFFVAHSFFGFQKWGNGNFHDSSTNTIAPFWNMDTLPYPCCLGWSSIQSRVHFTILSNPNGNYLFQIYNHGLWHSSNSIQKMKSSFLFLLFLALCLITEGAKKQETKQEMVKTRWIEWVYRWIPNMLVCLKTVKQLIARNWDDLKTWTAFTSVFTSIHTLLNRYISEVLFVSVWRRTSRKLP